MSFGLENLPYGVIAPAGGAPRCAVRYGDHAIDLDALARAGRLPHLPEGVFAGPVLNPFLTLGRGAWRETRARLAEILAAGHAELIPLHEGEARLPVAVGDYVDFYASLEHATNLGRMFRPGAEPLLPNWRRMPVGYHGRAGTVVVSGTPIARPWGQRPSFGPSAALDVELELGVVAGGPGNALGEPIPVAAAAEHIFGFVLVNDWSARDLQRFEYEPLGPFLGKSFATSISAWITPLEALEPHRVAAPPQDPEPLPYLRADGDWALDIDLEIELNGTVVSRTNARGLYWTFPQQLAHATVNGATARAGDLYASGTISGAERGSEGSLIELTRAGEEPLELPGGRRTYLEDGDTVVLRGAARDVSLGEVSGTVRAAGSTPGGQR